MENLLMRVKTTNNPKLSDDQIVHECMERLIEQYPCIESYIFERYNDEYINILMYGDFTVVQ
jgi:hypothetical protein